MREDVWRGAFRTWYDHREARHVYRARVWGWIADTRNSVFWK